MSAIVVGVDGGQTGTRAVVSTDEGIILGLGTAGSSAQGNDEAGRFRAQAEIRSAIKSAIAQANLTKPIDYVVMGMTGAGSSPEVMNGYRSVALEETGCGEITIEHDGFTCLLAATGGNPGIVVISGGGTIAFGMNEDGTRCTASGWGYILGDEGSGYNIGRTAINTALRAIDGRGAPTQLVKILEQHFELEFIGAIKRLVHTDTIRVADIASLAPLVAKVATQGDFPAQQILLQAGHDLADSAVAVARRLPLLPENAYIYPIGGVLKEMNFVFPSFQKQLAQKLPSVSIGRPLLPPALGGIIVALQALDRPIDDRFIKTLAESWEERTRLLETYPESSISPINP